MTLYSKCTDSGPSTKVKPFQNISLYRFLSCLPCLDSCSVGNRSDMSDAAEEAMDSSAVSEEEVEDQQEPSQEDQTSPNKRGSKISAVGEIIEGKRAKKTVERLDFQAPKQREKLKIGDGSGDKLGDIPRTSYQITKMKPADLKPLHAILFDRPGKMALIKKNLRLFNGFAFDADSEQFAKKREKLLKNSNFTNSKLKVVCSVLDLEKKGTHSDLVDRILTFLTAPKNSGKRLPVKKKRKSKKKLSGDDSMVKKKNKTKTASSSSSPKKSKTGSKSKAIVMDSSSDEDDDEEDEKAGASAEAEGSDAEEKPSEKEEEEQSDKSEESAEEVVSKSSRGSKRARTPAKKTGLPKKRSKKEVSDESESDSDADEKPRKKKAAAAKPAAKTKKADSSSHRRNNTAEDSSDDDEPLIKMVKKGPSDEQLKETVQSLLKEANLEEMTMKQICQRVFDTYPEHDLSTKKDFIKQTVKSLIT
ncbi:protein DEK isoform X3 [Simochromis diagramma]|uniref:protein DEK isoform X3 n=1 Tax=Simochromis diagramma TaxID=43689 RepID=UPI001A7EE7DE|nr:protein DEK isoform X3 [Simochromis diagramma]